MFPVVKLAVLSRGILFLDNLDSLYKAERQCKEGILNCMPYPVSYASKRKCHTRIKEADIFCLRPCRLVTVNIVKHIESAMRAEQKVNNFSLNIVLNTKLVKKNCQCHFGKGCFLMSDNSIGLELQIDSLKTVNS